MEDAGRTGRPPISLAHLGFLDVPPADFIRLAAAAGFASVSLRIRRSAPGGVDYAYRPGSPEAAAVKDAIRDTGVIVLAVETIGLQRGIDIRDAEPMLEFGAAVGATRLYVSGDDECHAAVTDKLVRMTDLAGGYGIAVDLEFMPFRAVRSLRDAVRVVGPPGTTGGFILLDMLHLIRSGGTVEEVAGLDPRLIGGLQLCDGPLAPPSSIDLLITEAREDRLPPGEGQFPLIEVLRALPRGIVIGAETPMRGRHPDAPAAALCRSIHEASQACLERAWKGP